MPHRCPGDLNMHSTVEMVNVKGRSIVQYMLEKMGAYGRCR